MFIILLVIVLLIIYIIFGLNFVAPIGGEIIGGGIKNWANSMTNLGWILNSIGAIFFFPIVLITLISAALVILFESLKSVFKQIETKMYK